MTEKTVHTVAVVAAAAVVLWALAHYLSERKAEREERSPGATNIGPETTLKWSTRPNDARQAVSRSTDLLKRVASLKIVGNVP